MFVPLPLQKCVSPSRGELDTVFRQTRAAWFLRYTTEATAPESDSFRWVCRPPYGLERLSGKVRNNIRRGLRRTDVRPITFREIINRGWEAHSDTVRRHGGKADGFGLDVGLDECGAYEAWGAFVGDFLVAYAVTLVMDDWAHFLVARSTDRHLKLYANNALLFFVCERLFERGNITAICRGFQSIKGPDGLENYNASMGFMREPVQEILAIRPTMRILLNRYTVAAALPVLKRLRFERAVRVLRMAGIPTPSA